MKRKSTDSDTSQPKKRRKLSHEARKPIDSSKKMELKEMSITPELRNEILDIVDGYNASIERSREDEVKKKFLLGEIKRYSKEVVSRGDMVADLRKKVHFMENDLEISIRKNKQLSHDLKLVETRKIEVEKMMFLGESKEKERKSLYRKLEIELNEEKEKKMELEVGVRKKYQEKIVELENRVEMWKTQYDESEVKNMDYSKKAEKYRKKHKGIRQEIESLAVSNEKKSAEIRDLKENLDAFLERNALLEGERNDLEASVKQYEKRMNQLQRQRDEAIEQKWEVPKLE